MLRGFCEDIARIFPISSFIFVWWAYSHATFRNGIATGNGEQIDVIAVAMQESVFPMSSEDSQSIVLLDEEVLVAFDKTSVKY